MFAIAGNLGSSWFVHARPTQEGPIAVRLAFSTDTDGNPLHLAQVLHVEARGGPA